jgi:hypothetical protein
MIMHSNGSMDVKNCALIQTGGSPAAGIRQHTDGTFEHVLVLRTTDQAASGTGFGRSFGAPLLRNCAVFNYATDVSAGDYHASSGFNASSNNPSNLPGANNQIGLVIADQIEDPNNAGGYDARAKSGASGLAGKGTLVLTTDLIGQTRADPPYIGPWEVVAAAGLRTLALTGVGV